MLKLIVVCVAIASLAACEGSNIGGVALDTEAGKEEPVASNSVTGSIVPTSAAGDAQAQRPAATPSESQPSANAATASRAKSAREAAETIVAVNTPGSSSYKIGPSDVLDVSVFKVTELSKAVQVSEAGTINLPLVGEVAAGGKTPRELEKELTARFGKRYLRNPQVTVYVKEYNSQRVTVEGEVKKPGVYPIQGSLSLLQAVALSQGMTDVSDGTVLIFRKKGGKRSAARFDISDVRTGEAEDPQLQAGDVIVAGSSALKEGFSLIKKALPLASVFALL